MAHLNTSFVFVQELQMSETKVSEYIEKKYNAFGDRFVDFEWLKTYLEEIVQKELHLVDAFFLANFDSDDISKWRCADVINTVFSGLVGQLDSILLCEILLESDATDESFPIASSLASFIIQDLQNIVIDYCLSVRFEIGMYVDALDADGGWDIGEIKQILLYKNNVYLFIHYLDCSDRYDECILASSKRVKLLYDDNGQIVYKWSKVDHSERKDVDYRVRGQCWKRTNLTPFEIEHHRYIVRTNFAPAGTFLTNCLHPR